MEDLLDENIIKKNFAKVETALKELPKTSNARKQIIFDKFGGTGGFLAYASSQLAVAFSHDNNLNKAFMDCPDKRQIIATIGACTEIGYMIAEERYEEQIKVLEAKLMIAEEELKKAKEG